MKTIALLSLLSLSGCAHTSYIVFGSTVVADEQDFPERGYLKEYLRLYFVGTSWYGLNGDAFEAKQTHKKQIKFIKFTADLDVLREHCRFYHVDLKGCYQDGHVYVLTPLNATSLNETSLVHELMHYYQSRHIPPWFGEISIHSQVMADMLRYDKVLQKRR